MYRIAVIFLLFLFVPSLYIYLVHIIKKTSSQLLRCCYWLPSLLVTTAFIGFTVLSGPNALAHHTQVIGLLGITLLLLIIPQILFMACSLFGIAVHCMLRCIPCNPFNKAGMALGCISFVTILYASTLGIRRFEVQEVPFPSPDIPEAFEGYRIVQLSDIHIGSWQSNPKAITRMVDLVNNLKPDLIVFTGDLVNQRSSELLPFHSILSQLHAPQGVYSILGNHDYGDYYHWNHPDEKAADLEHLITQQESMGWRMLNNSNAIVYHKGDSIALIGVENDGEPPFSQHANLSHAMKGTEGMFRILLSHNPTHWRREVLPTSDIPLMLAGHTHAMQSVLFGHSLAELLYPEWRGMYREGKQSLYVNIGIGYVGLPFRLGAWPEITVLTLHKAEDL